jgi:hypothetical protein
MYALLITTFTKYHTLSQKENLFLCFILSYLCYTVSHTDKKDKQQGKRNDH